MPTCEYIVAQPRPNDSLYPLAKFMALENAIIFIEAYMDKYDLDPDMRLLIIRKDNVNSNEER